MGYINTLSCECGYKVNLRIGTGRHLPDIAYIQKNFSANKLKEFNAALKAGCLGQLFYIENTMAYCKYCKKIKVGKALHFQINTTEKVIYDICSTCGHELQLIEEEPSCPECGRVLNVTMSGLWD